jgi:hypothetical protein
LLKNGLGLENIIHVFQADVTKMDQPFTTFLYLLEYRVWACSYCFSCHQPAASPTEFSFTLFYFKTSFPHILTLLLVGLTLFFALHPINTEAFC